MMKGYSWQQFSSEWSVDRMPDDPDPEYLYRWRTQLRSSVEYFEDTKDALMSLLKCVCGPNLTEGILYPQIKEARISSLEEARLLEAEIRDYLQLEGSHWALKESKKSIELSNRQLDESKRVKIFTILAFFYIPLNLATSVFGMNLQQLNNSGTSVKVFLGIAVVLLFLTGLSWLILEGVQDVRVFLRRPGRQTRNCIWTPKPFPKTLSDRVALEEWFVRVDDPHRSCMVLTDRFIEGIYTIRSPQVDVACSR